MGCGIAYAKQPFQKVPSVTGNLQITINNLQFTNVLPKSQNINLFYVVRLSNQQFKIDPQLFPVSRQITIQKQFNFVINSSYKVHGRRLEIQIGQKGRFSTNELGYGIIDMDPVIFSKVKQKMRCFLSTQREQIGCVSFQANFSQCESEDLQFSFETAHIRRKTRSIGQMKCLVRVTIGEQVLSTSQKNNSKASPPNWLNETLSFKVPKGVTNAKIEILDENVMVGVLNLDIASILSQTKEIQWNKDFSYQQNNDSFIAGVLRFKTKNGKLCGTAKKQEQKKSSSNKNIIKIENQTIKQNTIEQKVEIKKPNPQEIVNKEKEQIVNKEKEIEKQKQKGLNQIAIVDTNQIKVNEALIK